MAAGCDVCGERSGHTTGCPERSLTSREVNALIEERLGLIATLQIYGNASKKMIGDMVADALMHRSVVTIDGTKLTQISGNKPTWRV